MNGTQIINNFADDGNGRGVGLNCDHGNFYAPDLKNLTFGNYFINTTTNETINDNTVQIYSVMCNVQVNPDNRVIYLSVFIPLGVIIIIALIAGLLYYFSSKRAHDYTPIQH
jgi:hypothetical protein